MMGFLENVGYWETSKQAETFVFECPSEEEKKKRPKKKHNTENQQQKQQPEPIFTAHRENVQSF